MSKKETDINSASELLKRGAEALGDRAESRDNPGERSMGRTVGAFNALTGHCLTEEEGWAFMVCLKEARALGGSKKIEDDYVDGAAYFALQGESALRQSEDTLGEEEEEDYRPRFYVDRRPDYPFFTFEILEKLGVPTTGKVYAKFSRDSSAERIEGHLYTTPNGELRFRPVNSTSSYPLSELWAIGFD
jgi:hypothetical protein